MKNVKHVCCDNCGKEIDPELCCFVIDGDDTRFSNLVADTTYLCSGECLGEYLDIPYYCINEDDQ